MTEAADYLARANVRIEDVLRRLSLPAPPKPAMKAPPYSPSSPISSTLKPQ